MHETQVQHLIEKPNGIWLLFQERWRISAGKSSYNGTRQSETTSKEAVKFRSLKLRTTTLSLEVVERDDPPPPICGS